MPPKKKEVVEEKPIIIGRLGTNLKCGIVGLPNVGKSTFFNVLTKTQMAAAENFPFCTIDPNENKYRVQDFPLDSGSSIDRVIRIIRRYRKWSCPDNLRAFIIWTSLLNSISKAYDYEQFRKFNLRTSLKLKAICRQNLKGRSAEAKYSDPLLGALHSSALGENIPK